MGTIAKAQLNDVDYLNDIRTTLKRCTLVVYVLHLEDEGIQNNMGTTGNEN